MAALKTTGHGEISLNEKIELLEGTLLDLPQVDCPVIHHFGPGIYIREVTLFKDTFAVGHAQKYEHLNILLKGSVAIVIDGELKILTAPLIYVGKPGRKYGYVLEDTVWQNVYATEETDIDKLEALFLDKSATWQAHNQQLLELQYQLREADRMDFAQLLEQGGFDAVKVRAQSENITDQIPMPSGYSRITIRNSPIEGLGVFLSSSAEPGEMIGPARIQGMRTPLGRYINHAHVPNARFILNEGGDIDLMAIKPINGCVAGGQGDEVTVDYREALALSGIKIGETTQ